MALPTTPPIDTPTVTFTALASASAAPTIAGSTGWQREKRVGVATTAPGGSQTSTADLDVAGDTRFRYPSLPAGKGSSFSAGNIAAPSGYIPGGTSVAQWWPFNIEFVTSSPVVELRLNAPAASPRVGMLVVNGLPVQTSELVAPGIASAAYYSAKLAFPDSRPRRIAVYGLQQMTGRFGGAAVQSGHTITRPTASRRILLVGDSYLAGAGTAPGGATITETFGLQVALAMGADDVTLAGIGGTGWTKTINSESASLFAGRLSAALALDPPASAVVFIGGRNDTTGVSTLPTAVADALTAVASIPERWIVTTTGAAQGAVVTAIQAGAGSTPVIDTTTVTRDLMADGVHPTAAGHTTLAEYVAAQVTAEPDDHTGTATLTGAGTLTTSTTPRAVRAAGLSGSGTLTAAGRPGVARPVALTGAGALAATPGPISVTRAVALTGAGVLAAVGAPGGGQYATIAALGGTGVLTVTARPGMTRAVALSGTGALTASRRPVLMATAALTGPGTLVAAGTVPGAPPAGLVLHGGGPVGHPFTVTMPRRLT